MRAEKPKYTAVAGTEAKLVCIGEEVTNDPLTFLSWEFNGTKLHNSSNQYVITNHFTIERGSTPTVHTQLSVLNVRYADSGNYSCIVNTDRVTDKGDTITLEVKAKGKKTVKYINYKDLIKISLTKTIVSLHIHFKK